MTPKLFIPWQHCAALLDTPVEENATMRRDECHAEVHRGVENWNPVWLDYQCDVLRTMIDADLAAGGRHSGHPVAAGDEHPLAAILDYLTRTLDACRGGR